MKIAWPDLVDRWHQRDRRALARLLTLVENDTAQFDLLNQLHRGDYQGQVIGVTGAPGVGKSTFISRLVHHYAERGERVGCLLIDPSSPFSGGAILGDRIRMLPEEATERVFVRSLASRGSSGGLALAAARMTLAMLHFGMDRVIVETVGAGQTDHDIYHIADTVCILVAPGGGDHIQAIKAGIFEIADVFVVNKADLPGAEITQAEITEMLHTFDAGKNWTVPVLTVVSKRNEHMAHAAETFDKHFAELQESCDWKGRKVRRHTYAYDTYIQFQVMRTIARAHNHDPKVESLRSSVTQLAVDPIVAGAEAFRHIQGKDH